MTTKTLPQGWTITTFGEVGKDVSSRFRSQGESIDPSHQLRDLRYVAERVNEVLGHTMKFDPEKHRRRSIRLKGTDYSLPGAYFITICA